MLKQTKTIYFRRMREGRTNYKKRLKILISNKRRIVVRKSLKNISAQLADYDENGDLITVSASSKELKKLGWKANTGNLPASYLTGYLLGKKALKKNVKDAVLDIGLTPSTKGSRVYALVKGAIEAGLKIPVDNEMLPSNDDVKGSRIASYAQMLNKDNEKYNRYFSVYLENGLNPAELSKHFEDIKKNIESSVK